MFRVFEQPLGSYQEHSKLLTSKRYRHLLALGRKNYKDWLRRLEIGYAYDNVPVTSKVILGDLEEYLDFIEDARGHGWHIDHIHPETVSHLVYRAGIRRGNNCFIAGFYCRQFSYRTF